MSGSDVERGRKGGATPSPKVKKKKTATGKTIEETYVKMSPLEHILLRPDSYVGSIEETNATLWVYDSNAGENGTGALVHRNVAYVPGLYKIFDEILVNAADNKQRDSTMDTIKVEINKEEGSISVYNNGAG
eukprot:TRINITY_DN7200_c0_g1_i1.p1 TRINITY_DN7200_c0_g1~~TRINITY_DN7200_c0_g1_i1.p1  ORF type:complete len:153 (-),score=49.85 TRINITY_DN7200_c0_g1_i1:145-540(-)